MISDISISNTDLVDPNLLKTFVTVVRCGSFSVAAQNLQYTQSAVSQQIASLEEDIGATLLTRRPVATTEAGARLLEHAEPILLRLAAARADVARASGQPPEALTVATSALALTPRVAGALRALRARHPRLDLTVQVSAREEVVTAVATGHCEVGLIDGIAAPNDPLRLWDEGTVTAVGVAERDLVVTLPTTHPMASRSSLRLADLVDAWWIDAADVAAPLVALRSLAGTDGLRSAVFYDGIDASGLLALVAAGHGLAVMPADQRLPADVIGVRLASPRLVYRIELLHGRHASEPAAWLADNLSAS